MKIIEGAVKQGKDKEYLTREYVEKERSINSLRKEFRCRDTKVKELLKKYGIEIRKAKVDVDKDFLVDEYVTEGKSINKIAEELGYCHTVISDRLDEYGIKKRNLKRVNIDKGFLVKEYEENKRSAEGIGEELGCHSCTVRYWLKRFGIRVRDCNETKKGKSLNKEHKANVGAGLKKYYEGNPHHMTGKHYSEETRRRISASNTGRHNRKKELVVDRLYKDKEWMYRRYVEDECTMAELAKEAGTYSSTICDWLHRFGIPTRTIAEALKGQIIPEEQRKKISATLMGKMVGEKNPFYGRKHTMESRKKMSQSQSGSNHWKWQGGKSQDRNRGGIKHTDWIRGVYARSGNRCVVCSKTGKKNLVAHHVSAWNRYESMRYSVNNGVVMCKDCHRAFHKRYGMGNNTLKQFLNFLTDKGVNYEIK